MAGDGPFLWLSEKGPPSGFRHLPEGGMCLSTFLFVQRGSKILLGKYADDPAWEQLTGLDPDRWRIHGKGWTIPATHVKYGEDPRQAALRIGEEVLGIRGLKYGEPRVEVDVYEPKRFPGREHYDVWFLVEAPLPATAQLVKPSWYAALEWQDPRAVPREAYARGHEDVVGRWLQHP